MNGNIGPLASYWLEAKAEEEYAKARRVEIEKQMIGALEIPDEGSKTHHIDGYKVTVTQPVARKLDAEVWENVKDKIDPTLHPVKLRIEADSAGCRYLADKDPKIWKLISKAFTFTPGKVGFKVEEE